MIGSCDCAHSELLARELGLCALRMKIEDKARHFLDIVDAEKADGHLRKRVARLHDGVRADDDVATAAIPFAMVNGDNVGRSAGPDGASAAANDDEDALIGDGINRFEPFEISEKRRGNDTQTNQEKG